MNTQNRTSPRRAFTLIELLAAIAIVGMLVAVVVGIAPGIAGARKAATTRGYVAAMRSSLESFNNTYGQYPTVVDGGSDSSNWQHILHDGLTGLKVLKQVNGSLQFISYQEALTDKSKTPVRLPFLTNSQVPEVTDTGDTNPTDENFAVFADAWDNAFEYRYAPISGGKLTTTWTSPGFILISSGAKYDGDTPQVSDFFIGSMETAGEIPDNYFDDKYRADNITNWKVE